MIPKMHYKFEVPMENAIGKYHKLRAQSKRDMLFQQQLYEPFVRIAKSAIRFCGRKPSRDIVDDVVSFMVVNALEKLNPPTGRCLSYLWIAARNYVWTYHLQCRWTNNRQPLTVVSQMTTDTPSDTHDSLTETVHYLRSQRKSVYRKHRPVIDAAVGVIKDMELFDCSNYREICKQMRKRSGFKQSQLTFALKKIRKQHTKMVKSLWHTR